MLKALLKKQTLEFFAMFTGNGKTGKKVNKKGLAVLYVIIFAYAFGVGGFVIYNLTDVLALFCTVWAYVSGSERDFWYIYNTANAL